MNKILFITNSFPDYFYRFCSMPIGEEVNQYLGDRKTFIRNISNKDNLYVRLSKHNYERKEKEDLLNEFPELKFDETKKINYKKFDLIVIDHPITSLLEVMQLNVPVIMFWDNSVWEANDKFYKYIERFYVENIYWCFPYSAALYVNSITDFKEWWKKIDKSIVNDFKKEFTSSKIQTINKILKEIN